MLPYLWRHCLSIQVHFSDDLVKLVREVRELSSLGFPIKVRRTRKRNSFGVQNLSLL
jgi:hypothetical protein